MENSQSDYVPECIIMTFYCKVCKRPITKPSIQRHVNSKDHNYNLDQIKFKELREKGLLSVEPLLKIPTQIK